MRLGLLAACAVLAAACALLPRGRSRQAEERRGAELYARMCAVCHGDGGEGFKADRAPALSNPDFLASAPDSFLYRAIADGRKGTTMSAFGAEHGGPLSRTDVDAIITFMRGWSNGPAAAAAPPAPAPRPLQPSPIPLGPVPLNPQGPEPEGFLPHPATTPVDVVKAQLDRGAKLAFLDARAPADYLREHIPGAVSVPFYDPAPYFSGLPKDAWLVCYCACPHAESQTLAGKLQEAGFTKVTVLDEGMGVWRNRGFGMRSGSAP